MLWNVKHDEHLPESIKILDNHLDKLELVLEFSLELVLVLLELELELVELVSELLELESVCVLLHPNTQLSNDSHLLNLLQMKRIQEYQHIPNPFSVRSNKTDHT